MVYDVADVNDCGEYYSINFVTKNTGQFLREGSTYIPLSNVAAEEAQKGVDDGMIVSFPKGLLSEVTLGDLTFQPTDGLVMKQRLTINKARNLLSTSTSSINGFDFMNFFLSNNTLASKGYFVTEANREEKYIEIINTGDTDLILALEEYLTSLDRLGLSNYQYKRFKTFSEEVEMCETEDEVSQLEKDYYST